MKRLVAIRLMSLAGLFVFVLGLSVSSAPGQTSAGGHGDEILKRICEWRKDEKLKKYTEGIPGIDEACSKPPPKTPLTPASTLAEAYQHDVAKDANSPTLRPQLATALQRLSPVMAAGRETIFAQLTSTFESTMTTATDSPTAPDRRGLPETRQVLLKRFTELATPQTPVDAGLRQRAAARVNDLAAELKQLTP